MGNVSASTSLFGRCIFWWFAWDETREDLIFRFALCVSHHSPVHSVGDPLLERVDLALPGPLCADHRDPVVLSADAAEGPLVQVSRDAPPQQLLLLRKLLRHAPVAERAAIRPQGLPSRHELLLELRVLKQLCVPLRQPREFPLVGTFEGPLVVPSVVAIPTRRIPESQVEVPRRARLQLPILNVDAEVRAADVPVHVLRDFRVDEVIYERIEVNVVSVQHREPIFVLKPSSEENVLRFLQQALDVTLVRGERLFRVLEVDPRLPDVCDGGIALFIRGRLPEEVLVLDAAELEDVGTFRPLQGSGEPVAAARVARDAPRGEVGRLQLG
mmetsp:Transcript_15190/g.38535  ORF Transcript_15190/g.38535 Transcript_15190/m.38535 type:complete len:328 (+) Transcript_15190:859-1842(+)